MAKKLPSGKIYATRIRQIKDLATMVRAKRKADGLTQAQFAAVCGVGNRFISDLENAKPTVQFEKVLQVLSSLGLEVIVDPRRSYMKRVDK